MPPRALKPWDAPFPAISYSESQERRRRQCARAHYHAVYTAHQGWRAPPQSDAWRAYRLKKAVPLQAAIGIAVHEAATHCVMALRAGRALPTFETLRARAALTLNIRWRNSRTRRHAFLQAPNQVPVFLEALYGDGPSREALERAALTLDRALAGVLSCETVWEWVRSAAPDDVILMDPFASMSVATADGQTTCFGSADLIVRPRADALWHIIDFKTGSADGVVDQIMTYALVARSVLALDIPRGCLGVVVSLSEAPSDAVGVFAITPEDLAEAEDRLNHLIGQLRALIADQGSGRPMALEAFPMAAKPKQCAWCTYRALCHPERVDERSVFAPLVAARSE